MDIKIKSEKENFKFRVCGILTHNDKYLLVKIQDNPFYCLPGGHAEIGEDTITAVKREMGEELGFPIKIKRLTAIAQNFFKRPTGEMTHEFSYYYLVEAQDENDVYFEDYEVEENDKGFLKTLQFKWMTADEIKNVDCRPNFLNKILNPAHTLHVINKYEEVEIEELC